LDSTGGLPSEAGPLVAISLHLISWFSLFDFGFRHFDSR
jgi:hypothetical protein